MRLRIILLTVVLSLSLCGCMISTQDGERTHVNSKHPDEIAFHFDTPFNTALVFGRSALLLLVPLLLWKARSKGGDAILPGIVAVACLAAAIWWFHAGWTRASGYRIDVGTEALSVRIPGSPDFDITWEQVESVDVKGTAYDVRLADKSGVGVDWAPEWEDLTIGSINGTFHDVDLRPLSVEQRGNLWRAIVRKAKLGNKFEYMSSS